MAVYQQSFRVPLICVRGLGQSGCKQARKVSSASPPCAHAVTNSTATAAANSSSSPDKLNDSKPFSSIPGPRRWPIIGSLLPYKIGLKTVDRYHEYLREMYDQYGPVVREDQGDTTIVHLFAPEDMHSVYRSTTVPYVPPLLQTAKDYKQHNGLNLGLGNTNGPEWEALRRGVNKFTLKPQAANHYISKQDEVARDAVQLMDQLLLPDGSFPAIETFIDRWITESLGLVVTGSRSGYLDPAQQKTDDFATRMAASNRRIFKLSAELKLSSGLYRRFVTPKARKLKREEDKFYGELVELCNALITSKQQGRRRKCDELVSDEQQQEDDSILYRMMTDGALSRDDLVAVTTSLLTDGYSTTAPTLLAALHCLALAPAVQQQLQQQLSQHCPQQLPLSSSSLDQADKMAAFLKEVFRLFPIGDGVQRLLARDMTLSGYRLPQGTRVDLNPIVWLRDPAVFPEPEQVLLKRWSRPPQGGLTELFHPVLNTPFSTGARTCVGRRLAEHDLSCFLTRLLQHYSVSLAEHKQPRQVYRVLLRPHTPIPLLFHPR